MRGLLFTSYGEPRLVIPGLIGVAIAFVVALALITFTNRPRTEEQHAEVLLRSGHPARAEQMYAKLVRERPSVPLVLALLDAHDAAIVFQLMKEQAQDKASSGGGAMGGMSLPESEPPMSEPALDQLLSELPADISTIARFSRGVARHSVPEELREKIIDGAKREPPMPWANHLLAREAEREQRREEASAHYEKEGLAFEDRRADVDKALEIWMEAGDWDTLRQRLADPRVAKAAGPLVKYKLAVHDKDWQAAAKALPAIWRPHFGGTGLVMSAITAFGWAFFCARLGKLGSRVRFRLPMYIAAFILGIASVVPTIILIAIEEAKLNLHDTGDPARDILFFVFGVGLREEAAKILLFLPLLPILRKWGDKLDVLVCGALVGLGFAAEENLNYLAADNITTGLGRFLTANFFHMALTGTLASAVDDFVTDRERNAAAFTRTSLFVVGIHGVYDFLLSHEEYGGSYFAMTAFVLLTRLFFNAVEAARKRADRGITPLHAFVGAVAVVTGVSLAYAVIAVGAKAALLVMGAGLLGEAIIVYVFVRQLRTL